MSRTFSKKMLRAVEQQMALYDKLIARCDAGTDTVSRIILLYQRRRCFFCEADIYFDNCAACLLQVQGAYCMGNPIWEKADDDIVKCQTMCELRNALKRKQQAVIKMINANGYDVVEVDK